MIGDDKINLLLSAPPTNLFEDQRGTELRSLRGLVRAVALG
jgi:hypothetical protein